MSRADFYREKSRRYLARLFFMLIILSVSYSCFIYIQKFESSLKSQSQRIRDIGNKVDRYIAFQSKAANVKIPDTSQPDLRLPQFIDSFNRNFPEFKLNLEGNQQESDRMKINYRITGESNFLRILSLFDFLNSLEYPFVFVDSYSLRDRETAISFEIKGAIVILK